MRITPHVAGAAFGIAIGAGIGALRAFDDDQPRGVAGMLMGSVFVVGGAVLGVVALQTAARPQAMGILPFGAGLLAGNGAVTLLRADR